MTTGHAQDAEQPETGITPGDKGAFRDVLSKDHARRGKPPVHLVDMTPDERIARAKDLGLPKFRVKQLANHYFGRLETESEAFTDLPAATRGDIVEAFFPPLIDEVTHQVADQGTTIKTLWRLFDGSHIESVLMRYPNRTTLCISSQVGCGMGCPFCATGKLGLTRNMSTGEILEHAGHTDVPGTDHGDFSAEIGDNAAGAKLFAKHMDGNRQTAAWTVLIGVSYQLDKDEG